ncbi:MAG: hypothetical protein ABIP48_12195, partial [Planctomycetota bacterium]
SQRIADVLVKTPQQAKLGGRLPLDISVVDDAQEPVRAVVPIQVEILDTNNRPAEFSGFYGAKDGRLTVTADLASNDSVGQWTWRVTELASGITREGKIAVSQGER